MVPVWEPQANQVIPRESAPSNEAAAIRSPPYADSFLTLPPGAHPAGVRAILAVAARLAAKEPPPAFRSQTLSAEDDAGGFAGELLPDGVDQEQGAVAEDDLAARLANDVHRF